MNELLKYFKEIAGLKFEIQPRLKRERIELSKNSVNGCNWYAVELIRKPYILSQIREDDCFWISQFE